MNSILKNKNINILFNSKDQVILQIQQTVKFNWQEYQAKP